MIGTPCLLRNEWGMNEYTHLIYQICAGYLEAIIMNFRLWRHNFLFEIWCLPRYQLCGLDHMTEIFWASVSWLDLGPSGLYSLNLLSLLFLLEPQLRINVTNSPQSNTQPSQYTRSFRILQSQGEVCLTWAPQRHRGVCSRRGTLIPCQLAYLQRDRKWSLA